jgi:pre-mRNA-splicing factor SYF1
MMARHQRDNRPLTYSSETGKCYADDDLLPQEADLVFEAELLRNPNLPSLWSRYLDARKDAPAKRRYIIFERAVNALPGSYKV